MHTASVPDDISSSAVPAARTMTSPDPPPTPAARADPRRGESGTGDPLGPGPRMVPTCGACSSPSFASSIEPPLGEQPRDLRLLGGPSPEPRRGLQGVAIAVVVAHYIDPRRDDHGFSQSEYNLGSTGSTPATSSHEPASAVGGATPSGDGRQCGLPRIERSDSQQTVPCIERDDSERTEYLSKPTTRSMALAEGNEQQAQWSCALCTFANYALLTYCEMCGQEKLADERPSEVANEKLADERPSEVASKQVVEPQRDVREQLNSGLFRRPVSVKIVNPGKFGIKQPVFSIDVAIMTKRGTQEMFNEIQERVGAEYDFTVIFSGKVMGPDCAMTDIHSGFKDASLLVLPQRRKETTGAGNALKAHNRKRRRRDDD